MTEEGRCFCHVGRTVRPAGDHFRYHELVILGTFAQAVIDLHDAIRRAHICWKYDLEEDVLSERAYNSARCAVRCARMLELKEEYR